jgi:hypothetical protein
MNRIVLVGFAITVLLASCRAEPQPRATPRPAAPLAPLNAARPEAIDAAIDERERLHIIVPLTVLGSTVPGNASRLTLDNGKCVLQGQSFDAEVPEQMQQLKSKLTAGPVLVTAVGETYMAQAAPVLTVLRDARAEVWLAHPDANLAYQVTLRDEPAFAAWLDDPVPGKLRVIQRSDGFELTTNMGKLPGGDANGPTVTPRGGQMDLKTLQNGLIKIKGRFKNAPDLCFMPSYATALNDTVRAIAANYEKSDEGIFKEVCVVFPRPREKPKKP